MTNIKGFYEYLPAGYVPGGGQKYPLIIFFHGVGELASSGAPLSAVLNNGLPKVIAQGKFPVTFTVNNKDYSFIVISPQFNTWPGSADAIKFKNYLLTKYDIDTNRIYITGLSMGGGEAWGALSENKAEAAAFAGAAVVCGYYPPTTALAANIAGNNTPVWAFHNKIDPNVPPDYSINWVKYINATIPAPNPLARLTIFDATGHDAWTKAYDPAYKEDNKNMYEWMLQYSKNGTVTPPPATGRRIVVPMTNTANGRAEMYYPNAMTTLGVKPGDTLCIPAGEYEYLHLGNLTGTVDKPIVITNCGGQVKLGVKNQGTAAVFNAPTCRFVEISGSGDKNYEYGFDLNGTNITGLKIFGLTLGVGSSDFDVHNIFIHDGGIMLQAKTLQTCAQPQYWEGNYVMKNAKIHHIKCLNSQWEGFYIGNTHYFWTEGTCTDMRSHWIEDLQVYDNYLENIGSDALQISMAKNGDNRVYNNTIINYGMSQNSAQGYGILVGSGSSLKVYNNNVSVGYMPAVTIFGSGISEIYNNVISNIHYEGINVSDKIPANTTPDLFPPPAAIIYNNTIVNTDSGANAIKIFAYQTPIGHQVYNNLMVEKGTAYDYPSKGMYIKGDQPIKLLYSNNLCYPNQAAANFVDSASKNYRLLPTSTAVDTGRDMSDFNLNTDYDGTTRPQSGKYDVGAFELKSGTTSPPKANAGSNITITLPVNNVTLDGSASAAASGSTIQGYTWKKISGPVDGTMTNGSTAKPGLTGLTEGTYIYELTVTDNKGLTGSARVSIIVKPAANKPPVANAGNNLQIQLPVNTAALDGSGSTDADGQITTWLWKKTAGPAGGDLSTAGAAKTNVSNLQEGTYTYQLTVTDNAGASSNASINIIVLAAANKPPVANAGNNLQIQLPVNTAALDGSGSTDADGQITTWLWKKTAGPAGGDLSAAGVAKTNVNNLQEGTYTFQLTVTDNAGATNSADVNITVLPAVAQNKPPVANAGNSIQVQLPVNTAALDGSGSTDADGQITTWQWKKTAGPAGGDLSVSDVVKTNVSNLQEGTYTYQLTVTDNAGASNSATVNIIVLAAANKPPIANAGNSIQVQLPVNTAALDGSGSTDADGQITTWQWKKTAGPAGGDLSAAGAAKTNVSNLQEGTYTYQLTVTDNAGASNSATVNIIVLAAANKPPIANAGNNIQVQLPVNTATLDGSGSTDADGQITAWLWKKTNGPAGGDLSASGQAKTNITNLVAGVYTYQLTVTDDKQATATATVTVTVLQALPENKPPVAATAGDRVVQLPTASVFADGSASYDPDGSIKAYAWTQVSGPSTAEILNPDLAQTLIRDLKVGDYKFQLTVTDNMQATASVIFHVTVVAGGPDTHLEDSARIFPNPAVTTIRLQVTRTGITPLQVRIFDLSGKVYQTIRYNTPDSFQTDINISNIPTGYYMMEVKGDDSKFRWKGRFIKIAN
ncbi:MAG: T9SS type A sorting domain-containing protein [Chitinophaga sp.]|uniref:PKD domain-containing protein n=1 Tax=Chitinophaga sp. TaxID=1869181 RepID=UPI001B12544A|nr:PKD domain-containing protein [Chitinophaga sp.]MBO9730981.1 T9SS type A sorting domain-containing protein [Chitinophaga sp.]